MVVISQAPHRVSRDSLCDIVPRHTALFQSLYALIFFRRVRSLLHLCRRLVEAMKLFQPLVSHVQRTNASLGSWKRVGNLFPGLALPFHLQYELIILGLV